jgi:hypothetical protein
MAMAQPSAILEITGRHGKTAFPKAIYLLVPYAVFCVSTMALSKAAPIYAVKSAIGR